MLDRSLDHKPFQYTRIVGAEGVQMDPAECVFGEEEVDTDRIDIDSNKINN